MEHDLEELDREAEQIIKEIGIPPCPAILTKLLREMRNDEPDFVKLGNLIGGDVSLAAAMLKTVNSPFYGLRNKVASVRQAITLLGLRNVAQLVTGLLLRDAFPAGANELMEEIWESSSAIAQITAGLAGHFKGADREEAYSFGLFRDSGALAMIGKYDGFRPVLPGEAVDDEAGVLEYEDKCYGMNHARMGFHLARTWLLPDNICQAVLRHHDYAALEAGSADIGMPCARNIALALAAEELFVQQTYGKSSPEWLRGGERALALLDISQAELEGLAGDVMDDAKAA